MSFSDSFHYPHTVTVEPWSAESGPQGGANYGAGISIRGYVVKGSRMIRTPDEQQIRSIADLYAVADAIEIGPKDRVTLPDGSQPPVLGNPEIFEALDGSKVQHVVFG